MESLALHDAGAVEQLEPNPGSKMQRNVVTTILARTLYLATRVAIPPFVLAHIGLDSYGIWTTAFILVGYLGTSTMGISNVYIKYVAQYSAQKEYRKANELLSTGLSITLPFCSLLFGLLVWKWNMVSHWMNIPAAHAVESREAVLTVTAVFLSAIPMSVFVDTLSGVQAIATAQWIWVGSFLVETTLIFVLVGMGRGIRGMAEAFLARTVIDVGMSAFWIFRKLKWFKLSPRYISKSALKTIGHFGGMVQLQSIAAILLQSVERVAALQFIGVGAAGLLDLTKKWPASVSYIPSSFFSAMLPAASHLDAAGSQKDGGEQVRKFYLDGSRHVNLCTAYFCGLMAVIPGAIMAVWLGKKLPFGAVLFSIFTVQLQFHMMTGPGTSIVRGLGRIYDEFYYAVPNIVFLVIFLPLIRLYQGEWTSLGIGIGVGLSTVCAAAVLLWRVHRVLGVRWSDYIRDVFLPGLVPYVVGALIAFPTLRAVSSVSRIGGVAVLLVAGTIYSALVAFVYDRILFHASERIYVRETVQRVLRGLRSRKVANEESV